MVRDWCAIHGYTEFANGISASGIVKQVCAVCNDDILL